MTKILNPLGRTMQRRNFLKVAGASVAAAALPAFPALSQDKVKVLLWSWVPDLQLQVEMFNAAHPGIQIELVNAGQGDPQYQAVRAGLQAGSGLPDVVQIEFQHLESFRQLDAFADIGPYANARKGEFPAATWAQVAKGDVVNAMPQDTGPMAMLYRKDVFDKHGVTPPATWDEFADAAEKLHAADPNVFITNALFSSGDWVNALLWPMGWKPVTRDGDKLVININDKISKDFAGYWQKLITAGVIETKPGFTNEWYTGLDTGRYATWLTAGWGPVFLTSVAKTSAGQWRAADLPQWDASKFATGNWGGSSLAVLKATQHLPEAAEVAIWLCTDPEATKLYTTKQFFFPAPSALLSSPEWAGDKMDFYGGQAVNEVFAKSANAVLPFEWSPFQSVIYQSMADELGASLNGNGTLSDAFDRIQDAVVAYAKEQGFTVA
ncbi:MAG: extracellular solute-binding protein [Rhizobiaceae bacterium]